MKEQVMQFLCDESGATAIEYGLVAALIGLVAAVGFSAVGGNLNTLFGNIGACLLDKTKCPTA